MKTSAGGLIAAVVSAALLAATPAGAADPGEWLQRQFSTDHREVGATPSAIPAATSAAGARHPDGAGHAFVQAWLKRQFAGEKPVVAQGDGVAGRAGPIGTEDTTTPLSNTWLRHQFTTDHRGPETRH
ncbi:MAG TPA: hypothetical protein VGE20_19485 [Ramlibacter sp.]